MVNPFEETAQAARDWNPMEAGITHPNLGGAQVMDAGWEVFNPGYWWQKGSDWEHGTDHAKDYEIPWKFWDQDREPLGELKGLGTMGQAQLSSPQDQWRRGNANLQYNRAQINMNESLVRQKERDMYDQFLKDGRKPHRTPDGVLWPQYNAIPFDPDVHTQFPDFAPGVDWLHEQSYIQEPELIEAQSKWKQEDNMEITIDELIMRPEFEGWTRDQIKSWLYNQAKASRGGIIGLL